MKKPNKKSMDHSGSAFDSFLEEEGLLQEAEAVAAKRVLAWQLERAMKSRRLTKKVLAEQLRTSRSQVDRLFDPAYIGVSLETVAKAAHAVGKRIQIELVDNLKGSRSAKSAQSRTSASPLRRNPAERRAAG